MSRNRRPDGDRHNQIPYWMRCAGALIGTAMATLALIFMIQHPEPPTAIAMLIVGVLLLLLTARGVWPDSLGVSGTGFSANFATTSEAAEVAEYADDVHADIQNPGPPPTKSARALSPQRLARAQAMSPADYDEAVARALKRLWPDARVKAQMERADTRADFEVQISGTPQPLLVETKWRGDPRIPYRGSTLRPLVEALGTAVRLLVVVNSLASAIRVDAESVDLPSFAVVGWIDEQDDPALLAALKRVLDA